jgi:tRNA 2-thiouridine synthesizing protein C
MRSWCSSIKILIKAGDRNLERILILIPSAPYGTAAMVEGYRYAIGMASLEIDTTVVLLDDGVWAVYPGQNRQPCR